MIDRRQLLSSSMAAGLVGLTDVADKGTPAAVVAAGDDGGGGQTPRDMADLARAIDSMSAALATAIGQSHRFTEISSIRTAQKDFLTAHAKMPDIIEVGVNVWFDVYDWHIKWQQPINMGRDAGNRRTIALFETLVVLQIDSPPNFVGQPYDSK
jgi:hypothetical protein